MPDFLGLKSPICGELGGVVPVPLLQSEADDIFRFVLPEVWLSWAAVAGSF